MKNRLDIQASLEIFRNAHIHVAIIVVDVRRGRPLARLWVGETFVKAFMPEFDKAILCWRIGGDIDERWSWN